MTFGDLQKPVPVAEFSHFTLDESPDRFRQRKHRARQINLRKCDLHFLTTRRSSIPERTGTPTLEINCRRKDSPMLITGSSRTSV